ncbi:hypothetical protein Uis1B_1171 [Bifidobacterium margollesii]|uniref:Uncharacterized protein n=1 Tax=Bifidobacterium margollesii TaxID=2020964 RepID=A0A2N5J9J3_9BIFI|nr:hypothetical protein [Bifidobacterium margollesii]PLS30882.1 hypothetical protein Uis1B_1171 [Bifidobacterium margollesii]
MVDESIYEHMDDFTLYEVFHETGNVLAGSLVAAERQARQRGDRKEAQRYFREQAQMWRDREETDNRNRSRQIELILSWNSRRTAVEATLE